MKTRNTLLQVGAFVTFKLLCSNAYGQKECVHKTLPIMFSEISILKAELSVIREEAQGLFKGFQSDSARVKEIANAAVRPCSWIHLLSKGLQLNYQKCIREKELRRLTRDLTQVGTNTPFSLSLSLLVSNSRVGRCVTQTVTMRKPSGGSNKET